MQPIKDLKMKYRNCLGYQKAQRKEEQKMTKRINIFTHYVEELHASVKGGTEHH